MTHQEEEIYQACLARLYRMRVPRWWIYREAYGRKGIMLPLLDFMYKIACRYYRVMARIDRWLMR